MTNQTFSRRKPGIMEADQYGQYAVLVPILNICGESYLLFEKRSSQLKRQPGEICFPGGKLESGETFRKCAIRETMEELKVSKDQIEVLGPSDIYFSPFHLMIHPFIGKLYRYEDTYSNDEVEEIIKIPLDFLRNTIPEKFQNSLVTEPPKDFPYEWIPGGNNYPWAKGTQDILFYRYKTWVIWGMTAKILHTSLRLMEEYHLIE